MYTYKALVTSVYDGDTITVVADLGFHIKQTLKIRLAGINTPELQGDDREKGLVSKQRLSELVLGKEIILKTYKDKQEKFGRWLGDIYLPDSLISVNTILLNEGLADKYL
jgi:micrococcal nuclease